MAVTPNSPPTGAAKVPKNWSIGSLSRRTRRRGLVLSGLVGVAALMMSVFGHARAVAPEAVIVATQNLPAGTVMTAQDVKLTQLASPGIVPAVHKLAAVVGHRLAFTVGHGQPIVPADVASAPLIQGLTSQEVAVMLPVSLASSDNVKPNDRVDVIWVGSGQNSTSSSSTAKTGTQPGTVIASGLRVIAVLNSSGGPVQAPGSTGINATTPAAVEVAVPSTEVGTLAVAAASGHFWLDLDPWASSTTPPSVAPTLSTPVTPDSQTVGGATSFSGTGTSSLPGQTSLARSVGTPQTAVSPSSPAPVITQTSSPVTPSHHG